MHLSKTLQIITAFLLVGSASFMGGVAYAPMYKTFGLYNRPQKPVVLPPAPVSRGDMEISPTWTITEYTAGYESTQKHPGDVGYGITATGTVATEGRTAACDPHVVPMGTRIRIPQLGETLVCEDTGGAIKGEHVDVFVDSVDRALQFGKRKMTVEVLGK